MKNLCVALLVAMVALAGCSDNAAPPEEEVDVGDVHVTAGETTGAILGVVVDSTINPIPDATVNIVGQLHTTTTNEAGAFGFSDLTPGTYFLSVTKPGYSQVQQGAEVTAGVSKPPVLKVQLEQLPGTEPYFQQHEYTGYIACGVQVGNRLLGAEYCNPHGLHGVDDADPYFEVARPPTYYQSEITWEHTQEFGRQLTTTQYTCDETSCNRDIGSPDRFCQVWGPAPLLCKVTPETGWGNADGTGGGEGITTSRLGAAGDGGYVVEMRADCSACVPSTALGVGLILEQTYSIYNHIFYNFAPADEWRFLSDGAPKTP